MKKLKSTLLACGAIALLAACSSDDNYKGFDYSEKTTVNFTTNITKPMSPASRATDTEWQSGDAIGVYAIKANSTLEDASIFADKANIKHTTLSTGKTAQFVAAVPTEAIQLDGKTAVDIISYYPYTTPLTNFILPINVTNQASPAAIDILYSNSLKNLQKPGTANMVFNHMLSKLVFSIEPTADYPNLANLGAKDLAGFKAQGSFDLTTGNSTLSGNAVTIQPKVAGTTVSAILIPGQKLDNTVSVKFTLGTEEFTWTPSKDFDLTPGYKYTFRIQFSKDGSVVTLNPEGTIEDWVEGNTDGGVDVVTPGGDDGTDPEPSEGVMPLSAFITKYAAATQDAPITITEEIVLKGLITANDASGNIDKKIYIEDGTGAMGFFIYPPTGLLADHYKVGQEIEVNMKGLVVTAYGGAKQIAATNEGGKNKTKAIELADFQGLAEITNTTIASVPRKIVFIGDLDDQYINELVEVANVEFVDAGQHFTVDGKHTNRIITSADDKKLIVRTRGSANFATDIIPSGKVNLVGIVDSFNGDLQLLLRTKEDIITDGGEIPTDPETGVSVDKATLSFGKDAGSQTVNLKASSNWTISSDAAWLTVTANSGNGDATLSVNVAMNSGSARTGKLTIQSGSHQAIITVNQASGETSQPGVEQVVFLETFGTNTGAKIDVKFDEFDAYTKFTAGNGIVVSNKGSRADLRARSSVMNFEILAWLPSFNPAYPYDGSNPAPTVSFSNINTVGMSDIKVTFDMTANFSGKDANADYLTVYVDGKSIAVPSKTLTSKEFGNAYYTVELNISVPFSTLEFKTDERNDVGIRLDNVKVTGKK